MKLSLAFALAALVAVSSAGCASRPLRNVLHRGADCGSTVPATMPLVGTTTYSAGCGIQEACPTCGPMGGMPGMYQEGYLLDPAALPQPE